MSTYTATLPKLIWKPEDASKTNIDVFRRHVNSTRGLQLRNSRELHAWTTDPRTAADWWLDLFQFEKLQPGVVPTCSMKPRKTSMFPSPEFFPYVRMNFAQHILEGKNHNEIAMYACSEGAYDLRSYTWGELWRSVERIADAFIAAGVQKGDRVAAIISHCAEAIAACLATLSIGALWSTSSPDMGTKGIMDRLLQIQPKIVIFETSVVYNGKLRDLVPKYMDCIRQLRETPYFESAVFIRRALPVTSRVESKIQLWDEFLALGKGKTLSFAQLPFNHPGFIVYSSGTTGSPKCIVHSACGLLMQVKKDYMLSLDVRPGDTIFQYTTTGWIMWAMVLCGLSYGGKVLVYDGSPFVPDPLVTLRLVEKLKLSLYGTSARFLSDLKAMGVKPREMADLSSLRTVSSTGSVLSADVCEWFYDTAFPSSIHLVSASGGTDMACSLVGGDPTIPSYAGEIQGPALGMAVDVCDPNSSTAQSIKTSGEPGELVCRQPFPSQPVKFWGDDGAARYRSSYFEKFGDKVWNQGDFVSVTPSTGGYVMLGRSDGVLNPSGIRFGSAEIYNALANFPEFADTICVGQRRPHDTDETVILFVKMQPEASPQHLSQALISAVKDAILKALSPRHVPKYIIEVPDIPYTINGKKIELAVKQIVSGKNITPSGAVANPESLEYYKRFYRIEDLAERIDGSKTAKL